MRTVTITLYTFDELSEKAKETAILNEWNDATPSFCAGPVDKDKARIAQALSESKYEFTEKGEKVIIG